MKKFSLFILSTLLLLSCSDELKFVCTDIAYTGTEINTRNIQKEKSRGLGSEIALHFYDNSVKLSDDEGESLVLDRSWSDKYEFSETKHGSTYRANLTLEKWFGYIKAFTLRLYTNGKIEMTITYKRNEWFENVVDIID